MITNTHLLIFYRNFLAENKANVKTDNTTVCHIGLGVGGIHSVRVLRNNNVNTSIFGVWTSNHIEKHLTDNPTATIALIEAPWVPIDQLTNLLNKFPKVHFIVRSHSELSFLQVESGAIKLIRDMILLQDSVLNLSIASNSLELTHFLEKVYNTHCLYLPNLYDLERVYRKKQTVPGSKTLKISSFGATRLMKNHLGAAGGALLAARQRNCDLEFWVSSNREENGKGVLLSLSRLFEGLSHAKLIENPWQDWAGFRQVVRQMDLCIQMSFSETFNLTLCDGVAEGISVVGSSAIPWLPDFCCADPDSIEDIARVANNVLSNPNSAQKTFNHLQKFNNNSKKVWMDYLSGGPHKKQRSGLVF